MMQRALAALTLTVTVTLLLAADRAVAQDSAPAVAAARQGLDEAWWTGPMLAPSANTLPRGHVLIEPYLYDVAVHGSFDANGVRRTSKRSHGLGSLTYMLYGVSDRMTVGMIPTFGYNRPGIGLDSSGVGFGDLTVQAQYRFTQFRPGRRMPIISVAVQEALPTGRHDRLGDRPSDGFGSGAYTTTLALYSQTYFWLPNGRILRMRANVSQGFSRAAHVEDVSVYGTSAGFRGQARPGASFFANAAWEYSLTRQWVLALDLTYRRDGRTRVSGFNSLDPARPRDERVFGPASAFGFAPAIEYNFTGRIGILLGARVIAAGRNSSASITPALAINIVR